MPSSTFAPTNAAIVVSGRLKPFNLIGTDSHQMDSWNCQLEFTVTGTACLLNMFIGNDGTDVQVTVDGGTPTTLTFNASWSAPYTAFTGLSDIAHTVKIRILTINKFYCYLADADFITVTGSAPAISVTSGLAPTIQPLGTTFHDNVQIEGGWVDYDGFDIASENTANTVSVLRFRTDRGSIKIYTQTVGKKWVVTVDGAFPDVANIVTEANNSIFEWTTLASGLDTGAVHEYEIICCDRNASGSYISAIMLGSGATHGLATHTYTDRDIMIVLGTSIEEGRSDSGTHDFDGWAFRAARLAGLALCNVGQDSSTVSDLSSEISRIVVSSAAKVKWIFDGMGTNDAQNSTNQTTFRTTLESRYGELLASYANATLVSLGILPSLRDAGVAATYTGLKETAIANVADPRAVYQDTGTGGGTAWIDTATDLADTVHPNKATGHPKIAVQVAAIINPVDTTPPTVTPPATVSSDGMTTTVDFSETVTVGDETEFSFSGAAAAITFTSATGSGDDSTWDFTATRVIYKAESLTLNFAGMGTVDGSSNALANVSGVTVTNGSAVRCAVPSNLTVTPYDGKLRIRWTANSEPVLKDYRVYTSATLNGTYTLASGGTVTAGTNTLLLTSANDTAVFVKITSRDTADNESAKSSAVSATPTAAAGDEPSGNTAALCAAFGSGFRF